MSLLQLNAQICIYRFTFTVMLKYCGNLTCRLEDINTYIVIWYANKIKQSPFVISWRIALKNPYKI